METINAETTPQELRFAGKKIRIIQYNVKKFLLPQSIDSMACFHAKVDKNVMKLTIHDCKDSIQLWNELSSEFGPEEAVLKLNSLERGIADLKKFIIDNYIR